MFDEANLYENIDAEAMEGSGGGEHPDEAHTPALPPGPQRQIPVGSSPSPDGIGQSSFPMGQTGAIIPTGDGGGNGMYYPYPQGAIEPEDTTPEAAVRSAGLTALFVAASVGVGVALGGWKGGAAGLLLSGAVANGYRAQKNWGSAMPDQKHEAVVSSVFAVAGLGIGAYAAYKAYEGREDEEEAE